MLDGCVWVLVDLLYRTAKDPPRKSRIADGIKFCRSTMIPLVLTRSGQECRGCICHPCDERNLGLAKPCAASVLLGVACPAVSGKKNSGIDGVARKEVIDCPLDLELQLDGYCGWNGDAFTSESVARLDAVVPEPVLDVIGRYTSYASHAEELFAEAVSCLACLRDPSRECPVSKDILRKVFEFLQENKNCIN